MDERARAEVALLLYCCIVSLVTVGSSPNAVCLLLLAMADRRKRTFRWDHRLQIANTKTHEKNARKSARAERLHYCCTAVWCPWLPLFHRLPLSAYCCHTTAPSLQPLLHPCMICEEKIKCSTCRTHYLRLYIICRSVQRVQQ